MIHLDLLRIAANLEARERVAVGIVDMNADALRAHGFELVAAQPPVIVIDADQPRLLSPVFFGVVAPFWKIIPIGAFKIDTSCCSLVGNLP